MKRFRILVGLMLALSISQPAAASTGTWSDPGYQWRTQKPFTLVVIDYTTTAAWHAKIARAAAEWSQSSTADVVVTTNAKAGGKIKVGVVNFDNGVGGPCAWMQADINGGYLKAPVTIYLNDPCIDAGQAAWGDRLDYGQLAICDEMGHALGLPDHQTSDPGIPDCMAPGIRPGPSPTQVDFDKLDELYG